MGAILNNGDITLRLGQRTAVELPGLGAAGYRWQVLESSDAAVASTSWQTSGGADDPPAGQAGTSRNEVLTISAERLGSTTLQLRQVRPWSPDETAIASRVITVRVVP